jgi:hypothetical protein
MAFSVPRDFNQTGNPTLQGIAAVGSSRQLTGKGKMRGPGIFTGKRGFKPASNVLLQHLPVDQANAFRKEWDNSNYYTAKGKNFCM